MPPFTLHPKLAEDCFILGRLPLSWLLLMNNASAPWFILVPERADVREIHHLQEADQLQLLRESVLLGAALERAFAADKLNVAAIGNLVPQLHLHHVVRYRNDAVWPDPVWGRLPASPYTEQARSEVAATLRTQLDGQVSWQPAEAGSMPD